MNQEKNQDNLNREDSLLIIRQLERAEHFAALSNNSQQRAYILYFLAYMYFKNDDIFTAKEKLKKCVNLKSATKKAACYFLTYLWDYQMKPPFWRWWLFSPLYTTFKRILFIIISLLILLLFIFHSCNWGVSISICNWIGVCKYLVEISWAVYLYFITLLILILLIPTIRKFKVHDIEIELNSTPPYQALVRPPNPYTPQLQIIDRMDRRAPMEQGPYEHLNELLNQIQDRPR